MNFEEYKRATENRVIIDVNGCNARTAFSVYAQHILSGLLEVGTADAATDETVASLAYATAQLQAEVEALSSVEYDEEPTMILARDVSRLQGALNAGTLDADSPEGLARVLEITKRVQAMIERVDGIGDILELDAMESEQVEPGEAAPPTADAVGEVANSSVGDFGR